MSGDGAFEGTSDPLQYSPSAAVALINACFELANSLNAKGNYFQSLTTVAASGSFKSGQDVDLKLSNVGKIAFEAIARMVKDADDAKEAAKQAGLKLIDQDEKTRDHLRRALEAPDGKDPNKVDLPFQVLSGDPTPQPALPPQPTTPVKPPGEPAAGMFPMDVPPESGSNFILDAAHAALDPALPESMHTLAMQWLQLANSLNSALGTFDQQYSSVLGTPLFSGHAANQMRAALSDFSSSGKRVAAEAQTNAAAIAAWAGYVGQSKSKIEMLRTERDNAVTAAQPENKLTLARHYDELATTQLQTTWNLPLATLNMSVANISDPTSPVAGTPLFLAGMGPRPGAGSGSSTNLPGSSSSRTGSSSSSSAGPSSGAGSGGTKPPSGSGDPAAGLKRAGSGDPVSGADKAAAQSGSGSGNPASAAQSAASKANEGSRGLGGSPSATKSSGVGPGSAAAEAAKKAAMESAKSGGAGGGKGGAGGGGLGGAKLGAAGPEGSLSARPSAGISAAERGIAAEQAATRATPAGTSGAPMGGRGAAGAGAHGESEGKHKSARYLQSEENGEEIVGDLPEVAPQVLGGLNLDTTDDTKSGSDTTTR